MGGPWGPLVAGAGLGIAGELFSNSAAAARRARERQLYEMDPATIGRNAETFFGQTMNSPAMGMARSEAISGGQTGQMAVARQLGQTGLGRSGVGLGQMGAVAAAPGISMAKLTADAWERAFQMANQNASFRSQLQGQFHQPGMSRSLWAAGLNALGPYYMGLLNKDKTPASTMRPVEPDPSQQIWEQEWNQRHPQQQPWWQQQTPWGYP